MLPKFAERFQVGLLREAVAVIQKQVFGIGGVLLGCGCGGETRGRARRARWDGNASFV